MEFHERVSIGLVVSDKSIAAWVEKSILEISKVEPFDISFIISLEHRNNKDSGLFKYLSPGNFLISLYRLVDKTFFRPPNYALKKKDLQSLMPLLNSCKYFEADSYDSFGRIYRKFREQKPVDVLLYYGEEIIPEHLFCDDLKFGFWYFKYSNYFHKDIRELGIGELVNAEGIISTQLNVWNNLNCKVIFSTSSMIDNFSQRITLNNHFWKLCYIMPQMLSKAALNDGSDYSEPEDTTLSPYLANPITSYKLIQCFLNKIRESVARRLIIEQWILLYSLRDLSEILKKPEMIQIYIPSEDYFWADPFVISREGHHYIFFEEYEIKLGKGHISLLTLDRDGKILRKIKVLERPYHLAYPNIFEYEGQYYMIPDSSDNRTIELYRCTNFPDQWQFVKNIMKDVVANDTTVLFFEGKIWLFTCMTKDEVPWNYDDLYIFYNSDLFNDNWIPHSKNPVISDARKARPAGRFFTYNGNLFRPSQDCSHSYGKALNISRVVILNDQTYKEELVNQIDQSVNPDLFKIHTINSSQGFTIMDGCIKTKRKLFKVGFWHSN